MFRTWDLIKIKKGPLNMRSKIPDKIAAEIEFLSNRTCCVCRIKNKTYHIHHIDSNRNNNELDNLAILCVDPCHNQASIKGGLGRKLNPETIKKYRADWLELIAQERKSTVRVFRNEIVKTKKKDLTESEKLLEALTIIEVRKLGYKIEASYDWVEIEKSLKLLAEYSMYESSDSVKGEILSSVQLLIYKLRNKNKFKAIESIPQLIDNIILESMPIHCLVAKDFRKLNETQHDHLIIGGELGFELAVFGIKYLRDIEIVKSGTSTLWAILRYAVLNNLRALQKRIEEHFTSLLETTQWAPGGVFNEAVNEIKFQRDDAKNLHGL